MAFRKRSYQEIVDDILTDLTGGVVGEEYIYEAGTDVYPLSRTPVRAAGIASVTGTVNAVSYTFTRSDYQLKDEEAVEWLGTRPDADTAFYVSYYPADAASPITDRNVGSVVRTLVEAFGREVATLYAQLDKVYLAAFVDTAEGRSLEFVVSILGMERILAGRPVGTVEFSRSTPAVGDITIPLGTVVSDREDNRYETSEERMLRQGQLVVEVPVRAVSAEVPPVAGGALTLMPRPVVGIEKVTNYEASARGTQDESDEDLRVRAKAALYGAGKATIDAIRFAVLEQGVNSVAVHDMPRGVAGEVDIIADFGGDAEKEQDVRAAIDTARAAGIRVNLNRTQSLDLTLDLTVTLAVALLSEEEVALRRSIQGKIVAYVSSLAAGEQVLGNQIVAQAMADPRVKDVSFQFSGAGVQVTSRGDVPMGALQKASIEESDIRVTFVVAPAQVPTSLVVEGPSPVQVEASVSVQVQDAFVNAVGQLAEAQERVRAMVEAKAQAYFAGLFAGDPIVFDDWIAALASDKYTVDEGQTWLRNTHLLDGLVVTLDQPGTSDRVRVGEQLELAGISVNLV